MSGIEVAGLVLGALPFVLHSVDTYKDGLRRLSTLFKKRKHVEKLVIALLFQKTILEELMKSVVLSSGCADVLALQILDDDPVRYFGHPDVQDQMEHYLGHKNFSVLVGKVHSLGETVKKLAKGISGLVPSAKDLTEDLIAIIDTNKTKPDILDDIAPRVKLLFDITDIKAMIQEIDDGTDGLERFLRPVLSNCKAMESHSFHTSTRFTKAFRQIQALPDGLFNAVQNGFSDRCHKNHGVRLYLDDRVDNAHKILRRRKGEDQDDRLLTFNLSFYTGNEDTDMVFYETAVQVVDGWNTDSFLHGSNPPTDPARTAVTSCETAAPSPNPELQMTTIQNICTTFNSARTLTPPLSLAVTGDWRLATLSANNLLPPTRPLIRAKQGEHISLSEILQAPSIALPIKPRIQLSLRLACSLLQLQCTQWIAQDWSKDTILFHKPPLSPIIQRPQVVDLRRPFIVRGFDIGDTQRTGEQSLSPKATLLELGILLLEIWHGTTLETRFGPVKNTYFSRMTRALEWQGDEEMQGLYGKAISHCLTGLQEGGLRGPDLDWNNTKLWGLIYSNIVEPLSKLCKQF